MEKCRADAGIGIRVYSPPALCDSLLSFAAPVSAPAFFCTHGGGMTAILQPVKAAKCY